MEWQHQMTPSRAVEWIRMLCVHCFPCHAIEGDRMRITLGRAGLAVFTAASLLNVPLAATSLIAAANATPSSSIDVVHPVKASTAALIQQAKDRAHAAADIAHAWGGARDTGSNPDDPSDPPNVADKAAEAADSAKDTQSAADAAAKAAHAAVDGIEQNKYDMEQHGAGDKYKAIHDPAVAAAKAADAAAKKPDDVKLANAAAAAQNKACTAAGTSTEPIPAIKS